MFYETYGYTKVWLFAICNSEGDIVLIGGSLEEFIAWCEVHPNIDIFFHNLKFDGSFILNYLLKNEFEQYEKITKKVKRGFSTLIGEEGQFYSIKVNFKRNCQVTFYDSLKIIPLKVKKIAETFKLPMEKEKIDYGDYTINAEKISYVSKDVQIVAKALKFFKNMNFNKMTIGGNAYQDYKMHTKGFKQLFPILDRSWLKEWRKAYRGGRCQVNPKYANKIVMKVNRYDINSMYPYSMGYFDMPYDEPIPLTKPNQYKFELYKVKIDFKLKKGHLPTLLKTGSMFSNKGDTYYTDTESVETIYISNIDLDLVKRHYDIYYLEYVDIWGFKTCKYLFRKWVDTYYDLKVKSTGGLKIVYKYILNNLYGKFGSKCIGAKKYCDLEDDALTFELGDEKDLPCYYLPVAIAITSMAHKLIDDAIMEMGYDNFIYCDTDSVHGFGTLPSELLDNKEIGKFKLEGVEDVAKYIRQKCYIIKESDKYTITCSGMTESLKDYLVNEYGDKVFDVFKVGLTIDEHSKNITLDDLKLRPKQVKGGVVLVPVPFSLL